MASAASCVGWTPAQAFKAARVVLVGVMLPGRSEQAGELISPAKVRVIRFLKGHGPSTVGVQTAIQRSGNGYLENADGIDPHAGQRWKIYSDSEQQPYSTSVCDGSRRIANRRHSSWPFAPEGSVTHQSSADRIPQRAVVLKISWIGAKRRPIIITHRLRVQRVAHVLAELPKELPGECSQGLTFGPPTIRFTFRSGDGQILATAAQAALQNFGIAWCLPTKLSVGARAPIRLEGGSYLLAQAGTILGRNLTLPRQDQRLPSY